MEERSNQKRRNYIPNSQCCEKTISMFKIIDFCFYFVFAILALNILAGICYAEETQKIQTPRIPQFPTVQTSSTWHDDNSLRLGYYDLNISNIQPIVYYYECPEGDIVKSSTNTCNHAWDPFGGIDDTIKGQHCFTYRCDETAIKEPDDKVYHCEYENDGEWN